MHVVFSTKHRARVIAAEWRERLFSYLAGIAKQNDFSMLCAGGVEDHIHLLLRLPPMMPVAKAVQLLKGGASKWINETGQVSGRFEWQEGYGAFSIGASQLETTTAYIRNQETHHRTQTFEDEYRAFLNRHGMDQNPDYMFG